MKNTLYKETRTTYLAGMAAVYYDPGSAYEPAGYFESTLCAMKKVKVSGTNKSNGHWETVVDESLGGGGRTDLLWVEDDTSGGGSGEYVMREICSTRTVWRPEQPYRAPTPARAPTPGQHIIDANLGWNARARSKTTVVGPAQATFSFKPGLVGAVVGLSERFEISGYANIRYAVYASHGEALAYVDGSAVAQLGEFDAGTQFRVIRDRTRVRWLVDGVERYSQTARTDDSLFFHLEAALYAGGDYVNDPMLASAENDGGNVALPQLVGGGLTRARASAITQLPALRSAHATGVTATLPTLVARGGVARGEGRANLPELHVVSHPGNTAATALPPLSAVGYAAVFGACETVLPALAGEGLAVARGEGDVALPLLTGKGSELASGHSVAQLPQLVVEATGTATYVGPASYAWAPTTLPPLAAVKLVAGRAELPPIVALGGDRVFGTGAGQLPNLDAAGEGGMTQPTFAAAIATLLPPIGSATGLTGTIGGGSPRLPFFYTLGSEGSYGDARVAMPPVQGVGFSEDEISLFVLIVDSRARFTLLRSVVAVTFTAHGEPGAVFTAKTLSAVEHLRFISEPDVEFAITSTLSAAFVGRARTDAWFRSHLEDVTETWVINTETGAVSRYEGYDFNSFAKIGEEYFGAKSDGLYLLSEGVGEVEPAVPASVSLGKCDFGTSVRKRISHVYVSGASEDHMQLNVVIGDAEYSYMARASSEDLGVQRVDVGRGLIANYLEFDLFNDGAEFEVDSLEFVIHPSQRRI